jgi:hypothetical protein
MRITRTVLSPILQRMGMVLNFKIQYAYESPQTKVLEIAGGGTCTKSITGRPKRSGLG